VIEEAILAWTLPLLVLSIISWNIFYLIRAGYVIHAILIPIGGVILAGIAIFLMYLKTKGGTK